MEAIPFFLACEFVLEDSDFSSEDSSDDETVLMLTVVEKHYVKRKPSRIESYIERVVSHYTAHEFQQHFRITIDAYQELLRVLGPDLSRANNIGRNTVPVEKQILVVIWLLATPDSYRSVGERFDLGKSSLSVSVMRVIKALGQLARQAIAWPQGERRNEVKHEFYQMSGIQGVIGAVDGTFIPIKAPKIDPHSYITRKCNYAITLQGICDSRLRFTDVFVGYPGSVSDTRIFRNSDLYHTVERDFQNLFSEDEFILGDKAYPLLNWCIPPYIDRGRLTAAQRNFNTKHAQTRQIIERCFALLFGRFRRLKFLDMNRQDFIPLTVLACCVLHNICLNYDDLLIEGYVNDGRNNVYNNDNLEQGGPGPNADVQGRIRRDQICQQLHVNNLN